MLPVRLSIALAQGLLLYGVFALYGHGKGALTDPFIIAPAAAVLAAVPLIVIAGLGSIRRRSLAIWAGGATVFLVVVALHQMTRGVSAWSARMRPGATPFDDGDIMPAILATGLALFIAQSLITASSADGKRIASYPAYFDAAWKLAVQGALSVAFTGVFWLLLRLGSGLFDTIGLKFFDDITQSALFAFPATTLFLAAAIHVTDVRPAIIHGVRTLKLTLFSWLLPVIVAITALFFASMFFSIKPVWDTHHAAALFFSTSLALIYLLNAAYQDGAAEQTSNRFLKRTGKIAALLLVPLVGLAIYGTVLRVHDAGLTADRIFLLAGLAIAAQHAVGYAAAAFDRRGWMKRLEPTNIVGALLALAVYLLLFTPIADPARLSVQNQVARLKSGKVAAEKFDYGYLAREGAGYGRAALEDLKANGATPQIREKATQALDDEGCCGEPPPITSGDELKKVFTVHPAGAIIPDSFWAQDWSADRYPENGFRFCGQQPGTCSVYLISMLPDGSRQIMLYSSVFNQMNVFTQAADGSWHALGDFNGNFSPEVKDALDKGDFSFVPNPYPDIRIGRKRFPFHEQDSPAESK